LAMPIFGFHLLDPGPAWRLWSGLIYGNAIVSLLLPAVFIIYNQDRRFSKGTDPSTTSFWEEITRKMGITQATFYLWKKRFAGMGVAELRRLRQLEEENKKLKRLVADLSLDKAMLQDVLSKKV